MRHTVFRSKSRPCSAPETFRRPNRTPSAISWHSERSLRRPCPCVERYYKAKPGRHRTKSHTAVRPSLATPVQIFSLAICQKLSSPVTPERRATMRSPPPEDKRHPRRDDFGEVSQTLESQYCQHGDHRSQRQMRPGSRGNLATVSPAATWDWECPPSKATAVVDTLTIEPASRQRMMANRPE